MFALQYLDIFLAGVLVLVVLSLWRRSGSLARALLYAAVAVVGFSAAAVLAVSFYTGDVTLPALVFEEGQAAEDERIAVHGPATDDPYLAQLRVRHNLDTLVEGSATDLERILAVSTWVNGLWMHDGDNQPSSSDPLTIIAEAEQGSRFRCVEYAIVLEGALNALGIPARRVGLKTADVETRPSGAGHVVVEAYARDLQKWLLVDPQFNLIPVADGVPLHALELQQALASGKSIAYKSVSGRRPVAHWLLTRVIYPSFIGQYLYYFDFPLDQSSQDSSQHLMLVPAGAAQPQVFQGRFPLDYMVYTHNKDLFYAPPQIQ